MESIKAKGLSVFKDNAKGSVTFVAWRRKIITLSQETYVDNFLSRFGYSECPLMRLNAV